MKVFFALCLLCIVMDLQQKSDRGSRTGKAEMEHSATHVDVELRDCDQRMKSFIAICLLGLVIMGPRE
ncbi:hypothetical protein C0Q70_08247 [Pomacea canaliculata]|uniref:Uncharacterized protein n=1 Tax=Pomacea canaliculata TaxID=400727 RepID=A0A2T7PHA3_POMCA|nr:hypothetical protein C0Q70_08247 [Pomacea canaliculata]